MRRLLVLVRELPATSRLAVAVRGGPDHDGWGVTEYLLAAAVDAIQATTHAVAQVHSPRRLRAPRPLPRPGANAARARVVRVADLPGARAVT